MHLKKKFGSGFEMSLRLLVPEGSPSFEAAKEFVMRYVSNTIPWSTLNEVRGNRLVYTLPAAVHLSEVFAHLQRDKDSLGISDYSVSQTTIEQVFMRVSEEALAEASEEAQDSE
ncbi:hypothetical protein AGDE_15596 [Angomonas deanei]|nr:hypothetical protein AGDE_15596 [Angomonas deanei]|eukprot:EPY18819.1 hypothetical protein AGDE_15596 [Angomonas deanei]